MMTTPSFAHHLFFPWRAEADRRIVASESHWREPIAWQHTTIKANIAARRPGKTVGKVLIGCEVFEESPCEIYNDAGDIVDSHRSGPMGFGTHGYDPLSLQDLRRRLFDLIAATPHLDWLIATERPENIKAIMPPVTTVIKFRAKKKRTGMEHVHPNPFPHETKVIEHDAIRRNAWLGVIVSTQAEWDARIPALLKVPAAKRWVWFRDLKEDINLTRFLSNPIVVGHSIWRDDPNRPSVAEPLLHMLTISGGTGIDAPPTDLAHVRSIVRQGQSAAVPVWVDCLGSNVVGCGTCHDNPYWARTLSSWKRCPDCGLKGPRDSEGRDINEWPQDLRVRQLPG
jgi:hypothetical protein